MSTTNGQVASHIRDGQARAISDPSPIRQRRPAGCCRVTPACRKGEQPNDDERGRPEYHHSQERLYDCEIAIVKLSRAAAMALEDTPFNKIEESGESSWNRSACTLKIVDALCRAELALVSMTRVVWRFAGWLALLMALVPSTARAPYNTAQISGVVRDTQGGVLAGAIVVATHVASGQKTERTTDRAGRFFLPNLAVGQYAVSVELRGNFCSKRSSFRSVSRSSCR